MEKESIRYYNANVLLVINQKGKLIVVYTPFRVVCISASGRIHLNTWVYVEKVAMDEINNLQYVIFNEFHSYKHFKLPILY